ncbi:retrovirus-related pol polyprotein from transposon TNT 1-94 [Tanacetum coccineum]
MILALYFPWPPIKPISAIDLPCPIKLSWIANVYISPCGGQLSECDRDVQCIGLSLTGKRFDFKEFFENNDLKAQLQDIDSTICKLKDIIKSMREKSKEENVNYDYFKIVTKNVELENSVAKLLMENERLCNEINHVKQVFKEQFDSIKKTRVHYKEQVKGKEIIDIATQIPSANTIVPGMFKLDLEPLAPSNIKQVESSNTSDSNTLALSSTGLKCYTSKCGSKPNGNKRNDRISQTPSRNMKNKVEAQPRKVNKKNRVVKPIRDVNVKHSHRAKSAKKHNKQNIWKPTGHVFTKVGFKWKPIGRTFTIVGHSCPLTRITLANVVPPKQTTSHSVETQKLELKIYSRKLKNVKNVGSSKKAKIVESKNANHSEPNHTWGSNTTDIPTSSSLVMTVRFENGHIARIMGYSDYQLGNVTISRVYYVKGLGHNLFSVGQFCNKDLEVAFQKNTCFTRNLEGVDLLSGSRDTNLYIISLDDMLKTSLMCLLSKVSKTKSWLWHRQLSHLNFDNGTEFVNQTLHEFYENVDISHQTSVVYTPQQNNVVERRNQTLVEAARTMLIFSKALLFLWAEEINTACYTQNRSVIRRRYNKTPYELMQDKKPDLLFFHVFGALCYPTNDNDDLGKLDAKADIGIFIGYAPAKKAFRIYNKRTQKIIETIHVTFDELTTMASEQLGSGPGLQCMTPATSSSGLVPNPIPQQPCIPPPRDDWDHLFQPMFNEYFTPPSIVVSPVQEAVVLRAVVLADSPVSTSIN